MTITSSSLLRNPQMGTYDKNQGLADSPEVEDDRDLAEVNQHDMEPQEASITARRNSLIN